MSDDIPGPHGGPIDGPRLGAVSDSLGTRDRLLRAAVAALDRGGESAVKIREIASECGVTAPSIYHFFGSRDGLIEAALAYRYFTGQFELGTGFADAVFACANKSDFVSLVHSTMARILDPGRATYRLVRVSALGGTITRPRLAQGVIQSQREFNRRLAEALRFAQASKWVRADFNPEVFGSWLTGMINGRVLIELDPQHTGAVEWDSLAVRAVCSVLGIPEPAEAPAKAPSGRRRKSR